MSNLRRERDEMLTHQQQESTTDAAHVRAVQRENVQLNLKLKSVLAELEEIRSQREHVGMQADNVTRLQVKQLAELSATVKALEVHLHHLVRIPRKLGRVRMILVLGYWVLGIWAIFTDIG